MEERSATILPSLTEDEIVEALTELKHIGKKGLKSGLGKIDEMIGGIWRDGIVFSGKPGDGKTIFTLNMAFGFVRSENRVMLLDLENDRRDTIKRLILITLHRTLGRQAPTEGQLLERPDQILTIPEYWGEIWKYLKPHFTLFQFDDKRITPDTIDGWLKLAMEEIQESGKQGILIIDSINELSSVFPLAKGVYESLERWLAEIKRLRVRYQIPICLICHVPKDSPDEIFNPKGSSGIAHFARTQIIIKRVNKDIVEANVVRSQFGGKGKRRFRFDPLRLGLEEISEQSDYEESY